MPIANNDSPPSESGKKTIAAPMPPPKLENTNNKNTTAAITNKNPNVEYIDEEGEISNAAIEGKKMNINKHNKMIKSISA